MLLQLTDSVPPDSTVAYIVMQFCHFCGMFLFRSFISICRFTAGIQSCPTRSASGPAAALPAPATATSLGTARPSSPPAPAAASFLRRRRWPRPRPGGQRARPRRRRRSLPALAGVAVVYVFFAAAVPAGGTRSGHVPRARQRRCCGRLQAWPFVVRGLAWLGVEVVKPQVEDRRFRTQGQRLQLQIDGCRLQVVNCDEHKLRYFPSTDEIAS